MYRVAQFGPLLAVVGAIGFSGCSGPLVTPPGTSGDSSPDLASGNVVHEFTGTSESSETPEGDPARAAASIPVKSESPAPGEDERDRGLNSPVVTEALARDIEIEGEWVCFQFFWGSRTLTVNRDADSAARYHVHIVQKLDLGDTEYQRTATFENGIITLNEPVREFGKKGSRSPYTILYVLHTGRGDFLLPSVNAEAMKSINELGPHVAYSRRTATTDR